MRHTLKRLIYIMAFGLAIATTSCSNRALDYNDPDVDTFVEQLKNGTYNLKDANGVVSVPHFSEEDIPALLDKADDLSQIPSFPTMCSTTGKIRLGECLLWIVESIRLQMPASMGCHLVEANAENYEAIYFLTDDEVRDAVKRYRFWWENRNVPQTIWTIDPCYNEPLCGSGYRWW